MGLRHTGCLWNFRIKKRSVWCHLLLDICLNITESCHIKLLLQKAQGYMGKLPIKHGQFVSNAIVQQTCFCKYVPFTIIYQL